MQARWSDYTAPTLIGVIKPMTESDIQYTVRPLSQLTLKDRKLTCSNQVKIAQSNNITFLATGGGQSFSDYSSFNGISIDLGNFNSIQFDDSQTYLTIGGAVKYDQLTDVLYNASKELRTYAPMHY